MAFSINGNNLPMVSSYANAQRVFANSGPVRGYDSMSETMRGLVSRRDTSKLIIKRGDDYAFRYHRTDLVTWHSEDRVTIVPWDSISSRIFTNRFTPGRVFMHTHQGYNALFLDPDTGFIASKAVTLVRNNDVWSIENLNDACERQFKYVVDNKKARTARQKVKDYLLWCKMARRDNTRRDPNIYNVRDAAALLLSGSTEYSRVWNMACDSPKLVHAAVVEAGAVTEVPAPLGKLVSRSVYAPFI